MAKSKKTGSASLYLSIVMLVLVILGVVLFLFLDVVKLNVGKLEDYFPDLDLGGFTGMQVVFGYAEEGLVKVELLSFSIMALIPLILAFAGLILNVTKSKLLSFIGAVLLIVAAVMLYFSYAYVVWADSPFGQVGKGLVFATDIGAYIALGCFGVAAVVGLIRTVTIK